MSMLYSVIDIETTGYPNNRITEVSVFVTDGRNVVDEFHSLVNPRVPIPYNIELLTGINDEMVRTAPRFEEIAGKLEEITRNTIFVAHNVSFDYGQISRQFEELGFDYKRRQLCTVRLAKKHIKGHKSYSLGKICDALGIPINGRHRAKGDAQATVILLHKILQQTAGLFG
jgi:DNA polymerase-3 subunit epsilon